MALVTRAGKGSALTWTEMDANFTGLADGTNITGTWRSRSISDTGTATALRIQGAGNYVNVGAVSADGAQGQFMVTSDYSYGQNDWVMWLRRDAGAGTSNECLVRQEHYSGTNSPLPIFTGIASRGSVASPTAIQSGDTLFILDARGYDGSAVNHGEYKVGISDTAAQLAFSATENWSGTAHGCKATILTTPNLSIAPSEKFGIDGNGNVTLGGSSSTPAFKVIPVASQDRWVTITGSAGGNPTIGTSSGNLALGSSTYVTGIVSASSYGSFATGSAPAAGGNTNTCITVSSSGVGFFVGTGAPAITAPKGSIYSNTTATTTTTRLYVNTDGGSTWTNLTTAA